MDALSLCLAEVLVWHIQQAVAFIICALHVDTQELALVGLGV